MVASEPKRAPTPGTPARISRDFDGAFEGCTDFARVNSTRHARDRIDIFKAAGGRDSAATSRPETPAGFRPKTPEARLGCHPMGGAQTRAGPGTSLTREALDVFEMGIARHMANHRAEVLDELQQGREELVADVTKLLSDMRGLRHLEQLNQKADLLLKGPVTVDLRSVTEQVGFCHQSLDRQFTEFSIGFLKAIKENSEALRKETEAREVRQEQVAEERFRQLMLSIQEQGASAAVRDQAVAGLQRELAVAVDRGFSEVRASHVTVLENQDERRVWEKRAEKTSLRFTDLQQEQVRQIQDLKRMQDRFLEEALEMREDHRAAREATMMYRAEMAPFVKEELTRQFQQHAPKVDVGPLLRQLKVTQHMLSYNFPQLLGEVGRIQQALNVDFVPAVDLRLFGFHSLVGDIREVAGVKPLVAALPGPLIAITSSGRDRPGHDHRSPPLSRLSACSSQAGVRRPSARPSESNTNSMHETPALVQDSMCESKSLSGLQHKLGQHKLAKDRPWSSEQPELEGSTRAKAKSNLARGLKQVQATLSISRLSEPSLSTGGSAPQVPPEAQAATEEKRASGASAVQRAAVARAGALRAAEATRVSFSSGVSSNAESDEQLETGHSHHQAPDCFMEISITPGRGESLSTSPHARALNLHVPGSVDVVRPIRTFSALVFDAITPATASTAEEPPACSLSHDDEVFIDTVLSQNPVAAFGMGSTMQLPGTVTLQGGAIGTQTDLLMQRANDQALQANSGVHFGRSAYPDAYPEAGVVRLRHYWSQTDPSKAVNSTTQTDETGSGMKTGRILKTKTMKVVADIPPGPVLKRADRGSVKAGMCLDQEAMKKKAMARMVRRQYNVHDLYYETGCIQKIAKSATFEYTTLLVIIMNAVWIAIDTDYNGAQYLTDAHPVFQVVENLFCFYFTSELIMRFAAFRHKPSCLRDFWFVFDLFLVSLMILETWIITFYIVVSHNTMQNGVGGLSMLRVFRLVKLARVSRIARLLRQVPELLILVKGLRAASRSVAVFFVMWISMIYIYALFLRMLDSFAGKPSAIFTTIPVTMNMLLLKGILPLHADFILDAALDFWMCWPVLFTFVVMAFLMLMNMLVGVSVEVIASVAASEREGITVLRLASSLREQLIRIHFDSEASFSLPEMESWLDDPIMHDIVERVGTDWVSILELSSQVFEERDTQSLRFEELVEMIMSLRGQNTAKVKDVKALWRSMQASIQKNEDTLRSFVAEECNDLRMQVFEIAKLQMAAMEEASSFQSSMLDMSHD